MRPGADDGLLRVASSVDRDGLAYRGLRAIGQLPATVTLVVP